MKAIHDTRSKLLDTALEMIWESSYGSVSVDDMCERAGVKKGSFYHAFKSKSDLAVAAFEKFWEHKHTLLASIFQGEMTPLERLNRYLDFIVTDQLEKKKSFGKMLGCPFCSVGSELSTQDENIRLKAEEMSERAILDLEGLVRGLSEGGYIECMECKDVRQMADEVFYYITGVLVQAKIENSTEPLNRMRHGVIRLLGVKELQPVRA